MAPLPCVVITFPSSSRMISVGMPGEGEGGGEKDREVEERGGGEERWIEGG